MRQKAEHAGSIRVDEYAPSATRLNMPKDPGDHGLRRVILVRGRACARRRTAIFHHITIGAGKALLGRKYDDAEPGDFSCGDTLIWNRRRRRLRQRYGARPEGFRAQRPAHQPPPRRAAQDDFKKATILRAEGGRLHGLVSR